MTKEEAILISAYTGFLLTRDFDDVHKFCEKILDRPIFTHELADEKVQEQIREKCKPMIIKLIEVETMNGVWEPLLFMQTLALIISQDQKITELTKENKRLIEMNKPPIRRNIDYAKATAKTESVRKMQEKVVAHFGTYTGKDEIKALDVCRIIDRLAEEVLEEL